ncbi:putative transporter [Bacteroides acidifaciens]|uniref:putative transporter n=1 Tax=Bacteroides acidifaciens TaxID=85831 RepID=UPI002557ED84|nr:putative transporter [Bacteroides acidifaciens]
MEWINAILFDHSVIQAVVVISLIAAIGLSLGKLSFYGISLGVTFVFFAGIIAGHLGLSIDPQMLNYAESFGLIIFVYALGLQVGPGFFGSLRRGGMNLNLLALSVILIGTSLALLFHVITNVSLPDMVGILSGAVTNTPALGAAQQTIKQMNISASDPALGCAVTYPLGVVGVILAIIVLRKLFPLRTQYIHRENSSKQTYIAAFEVLNPGIFNKNLKQVAQLGAHRFVASRLWRNGHVSIPLSDTILQKGDRLLVITTRADEEAVKTLFGAEESTNWNSRDIDWNTIDHQLASQEIAISRSAINGKKLGSLRLRNQYRINITRIYRAGVLLLATPELILQLGDKLTVVGESEDIAQVEKVLGNRVVSLKEPNLVAVFIGIVLGLAVGTIPFIIPGVKFPIQLGIAGGPIIMGILMGAFGPRLHLITYTTQSANLMLRGLGLSLYLACLGLDAGTHFFQTVFRPEGLLWIVLGFAITFIPVILVALFALRFMKLDFGSIAGMLCGSMANPMALNYVNSTVEGDTPAVSYATVYPLSMFIRVILAQLILMLFL